MTNGITELVVKGGLAITARKKVVAIEVNVTVTGAVCEGRSKEG
jgi:hypothetical protein